MRVRVRHARSAGDCKKMRAQELRLKDARRLRRASRVEMCRASYRSDEMRALLRRADERKSRALRDAVFHARDACLHPYFHAGHIFTLLILRHTSLPLMFIFFLRHVLLCSPACLDATPACLHAFTIFFASPLPACYDAPMMPDHHAERRVAFSIRCMPLIIL